MSLSLQNLLVSLFWVAKLPVPSLPSPAHVSPLCPYLLPHSLLQCTGLLAPSRINQACSLYPVLAVPWAWTASPRWSRGSSLISFKSVPSYPRQALPDSPLFNLQPHPQQATQKSLTPFLLYFTPLHFHEVPICNSLLILSIVCLACLKSEQACSILFTAVCLESRTRPGT